MGYLNWRGLDIVGNMAIIICIVAMSPFVLLTVIGIFSENLEPSRWLAKPSLTAEEYNDSGTYNLGGGFFPNASMGGILLRPYLNNLFWNLNSFDSTATFSEDVGPNPGSVIPPSIFIAFYMVVLGYLIPMLVATGVAEGTQEQWVDGYFSTIAGDAIGQWLSDWTGTLTIALRPLSCSVSYNIIINPPHSVELDIVYLGTVFAAGISNLALYQAEMSGGK
jgi:amino acid transporter